MVQPVPTVELLEPERVERLVDALGGVEPKAPVACYDNGVKHIVVVAGDAGDVDALLRLTPDLGRVAAVAGRAGTSVIAGEGDRWTSRMFAPGLGVAEDPATGSAAGPVAVHLCRNGLVPWGTEIEIDQGRTVNRPSKLRALAQGSDEGIDQVDVGGDVVIVGSGSFEL